MRLITTLEELEALPKKAIVRDSGGNIFERWYIPGEAIRPPDGDDWYGLGFQDQCWSAKTIGLPAHVLWPEGPIEITDQMVEGMARMLHSRSAEGRSGFSWPVNGDWGRQRDLESAHRALTYVLTFLSKCNGCGATATTVNPEPRHDPRCLARKPTDCINCCAHEPTDPSPVVAIPTCGCSCHTMPGVFHVTACCNLSAADQGPMDGESNG